MAGELTMKDTDPDSGELERLPLPSRTPIDGTRKAAILDLLIACGRARRRRRIARALTIVMAAGLVGGIAVLSRRPPTSGPDLSGSVEESPRVEDGAPSLPRAVGNGSAIDPETASSVSRRRTSPRFESPRIAFEIVRPGGGTLERYAVGRTSAPAGARVDDEELLVLLREAGVPDGLVRVGGEAHLASELLADARRGEDPAGAPR